MLLHCQFRFQRKQIRTLGKKVPKNPDKAIHLMDLFDKLFKLFNLLKPAINKIKPVIIIRSEPNCIGLRPIKLFLMSMNELPQITAKRNKKNPFFIFFNHNLKTKVQKSVN